MDEYKLFTAKKFRNVIFTDLEFIVYEYLIKFPEKVNLFRKITIEELCDYLSKQDIKKEKDLYMALKKFEEDYDKTK